MASKSPRPDHVPPRNASDLVKAAAARAGVARDQARKIINAYLAEVQDTLIVQKRPVSVRMLGVITPPFCARYNRHKRRVALTQAFSLAVTPGVREKFHSLHGKYGWVQGSNIVDMKRRSAVGDKRVSRLLSAGAKRLGSSGE